MDTQGDQQTGNAPGAQAEDAEQVTQPEQARATFTQADVDRIVTERLERARRAAERDAARARESAEVEALERQKEFETLADRRKTKIAELDGQLAEARAELEPLREQAERYQKALKAYLATAIEAVPESVRDLLGTLDVVDQLEWIAKHQIGSTAVPALPAATQSGITKNTPRPTGSERASAYKVRF